MFDGLHDFRHARFVVGAEQGRPVRNDEFLSDVIFQNGKFVFGNDLSVGEGDVAAPIEHGRRLDVLAGAYGFGVQVGDKAERRKPFDICGDFRIYVAMFIAAHGRGPQGFELRF